MKSLIQINNTDITVRPSSIDNFLGCAYQWARVFLSGEMSIPSGRAAIGTGIHAGVEYMWKDAMQVQSKAVITLNDAQEAAVECYDKEASDFDIRHDYGEDDNTARAEIVKGVKAFVEDIVPFTEIPEEVEHRYTIEIEGHPIVGRLSGTVDYIGHGVIADVKTSKRKPTVQNYEIQQSIYKELAIANGVNVTHNMIQGVVLTKTPYGTSMEMEPNLPKARTIFNNLLDTLEILATDKIRPELLFRGNPKYYLCSPKYCSLYPCMFVKGEEPEVKKSEVPKL